MTKNNGLDEVLAVQKKIEEKTSEIKGIKDAIETERRKSAGLASSGNDLEALRRRLEDAKARQALGTDTSAEIAGLERDLSETELASESLANAHKKAKADFDAVAAGLSRILGQTEKELTDLKQARTVAMERFLRIETERVGKEYAEAVISAEKALRQLSCLAEIHNKGFLAGNGEIRAVSSRMIFSAPMWNLSCHEEAKSLSPFWDANIWKFPIDGGYSTWVPQGVEAEKVRLGAMGIDTAF